LFTGGKDRIVHAWDITRKKGMFKLDVGENQYPASLYFDPDTKQLSILTLPLNNQARWDELDDAHQCGKQQVFTFKRGEDKK
jgi:hypothetical protein